MNRERRQSMNYAKLEAFRMTLPEQHQHEIHRFFVVHWDIVKARFLIQESGKQLDVLNVASAARAYGFDKPQTFDSWAYVDPKRAMSEEIDTSIPVILALLQGDEGTQPKPILIDGVHRLYKAYREEQMTLPCYTLTPHEERQCRI